MPDKKNRPRRNQAVLPAWWLEVTPHYTLDLEDEQSRRETEERMAMYYAQLAEKEASKGMMFDIDGNPIEANPGSGGGATGDWKSNWTGRQKKGAAEKAPEPEKPKMFGGRNFKPGSPGWDPKQWGISANDPDYDKYLSGAMLPPQFIEAMTNFAKATGHYQIEDYASNLKKTDGAYGRLAEKEAHQPDWMKKKLRSTNAGKSIRTGVYDDSPNRHWKARDAAAGNEGGEYAGEGEEHTENEEEPDAPPPSSPVRDFKKNLKPANHTPPEPAAAPNSPVRDFRNVLKATPPPAPTESAPEKPSHIQDFKQHLKPKSTPPPAPAAEPPKEETGMQLPKLKSRSPPPQSSPPPKTDALPGWAKKRNNNNEESQQQPAEGQPNPAEETPSQPTEEQGEPPNRFKAHLKSRAPPASSPPPAKSDSTPAWAKKRQEQQEQAPSVFMDPDAMEYDEEFVEETEVLVDDDEEIIEEIVEESVHDE